LPQGPWTNLYLLEIIDLEAETLKDDECDNREPPGVPRTRGSNVGSFTRREGGLWVHM